MKYNPGTFRPTPDLKSLPKDATNEQIVNTFNDLISKYNFFSKFISFQSNFDGFIAKDVIIPATSSIEIQHFLGFTPKWRIILKQTGNGVISDVYSGWNNRIITLYNNGAVEVTASILIAKE